MQLGTQIFAVGFKVCGGSLQTMVHMQGHHLPRPTGGAGDQQGGGISPTTERHAQRQSGLKSPQGRIQ
jgi:hypothetical protein